MWALAISAVVTVFDVSWYDRAWELVDTDGMPFIAIVSRGECEGELADGPVTIRIGVVAYFTMSGAEIDVNEDGVPEALAWIELDYDDGHRVGAAHLYQVVDGKVVLVTTFADDVPRWQLTSVTFEDSHVELWRTRFRTRKGRFEIWRWNGDRFVEDRSRRQMMELPRGH